MRLFSLLSPTKKCLEGFRREGRPRSDLSLQPNKAARPRRRGVKLLECGLACRGSRKMDVMSDLQQGNPGGVCDS